MAERLNIVFGAAGVGNFPDPGDEATLQIFQLLKKNGVEFLDSSRLYGKSEETLGRLKAASEHGFKIDTKWWGAFFDPTSTSKERIIADAKDSLAKLGVSKVNCFFLHSPNSPHETEDTLIGINEVYKMGAFEHFGLSNFSPAQVKHVYDTCKAKGLVLPTIYEGLYSPVNRKQEEELLPLLRKCEIAFVAYSPLAGGFLTKSRSQVVNGEGRFSKGQFLGAYFEIYNNEPYLEANEEWGRIANEEGISRAALGYRWVCYHSALKAEFGDEMIIGGSISQLEDTFKALDQGPLSQKAAQSIEDLWVKLQPFAKYANNIEAQTMPSGPLKF
ncbi:hypothetical protein BP6252_11877 [Coleophoma cylindrospora]|uniref:NADP-dependent oxidoreductase domain-containing protein n=1 Tax=Coleophoma cylindrospora TaxID=1849047 RepID=A0A3D8QLV0_9HELO|nr:hypothetical protein BP6252_11877 [Coleophoma cylindrospora]